MIALNTQFEVFYPVNNSLPNLELLDVFTQVEQLAHRFMSTEASIEDLVNQNLDLLFAYRAAFTRQMPPEGSETILNRAQVDAMVKELAYLNADPRFGILLENIGFALRTNARVMQRLTSSKQQVYPLVRPLSVPKVPYTDFVAFMQYFQPNDFIANMLEMMNFSLHLEFGLLVAMLVNHGKLDLSETKLYNLEGYIARAAQQFGGRSRKLLPPKPPKPVIEVEETPELLELRKEDQSFADTGFEEWANIPYDEQAGY